jgi:predicted O-linked N-acetylglucosamine transferase (SPINDLY family)
MANSMLNVGATEQAMERFIQYERIKPASPFTACMVVFLMRQLADWSVPMLQANAQELTAMQNSAALGQRSELALLALRAWRNMPALEPFSSLVLYDDPALQRHSAQLLLKHMHPPVVPATGNGADVASQPSRGKAAIKVAYVSCDFKEHATSYLLAGVLARHNRERVQVFLLSYAPPRAEGPDAMQQRIATMGHTWVDIHLWSDEQVAQWCREQGIEVAVDLKGLTRDGRTGIFAHRAAPVQVNWLGYPGTLPAPY